MLAVFVVFAQAASVALAPSPAPDALSRPEVSFTQTYVHTASKSRETISDALPQVQLDQTLCKRMTFNGWHIPHNVCATKAQWLTIKQTRNPHLIESFVEH